MFNDLITNPAVADLLLATIAWHCFITAPGSSSHIEASFLVRPWLINSVMILYLQQHSATATSPRPGWRGYQMIPTTAGAARAPPALSECYEGFLFRLVWEWESPARRLRGPTDPLSANGQHNFNKQTARPINPEQINRTQAGRRFSGRTWFLFCGSLCQQRNKTNQK